MRFVNIIPYGMTHLFSNTHWLLTRSGSSFLEKCPVLRIDRSETLKKYFHYWIWKMKSLDWLDLKKFHFFVVSTMHLRISLILIWFYIYWQFMIQNTDWKLQIDSKKVQNKNIGQKFCGTFIFMNCKIAFCTDNLFWSFWLSRLLGSMQVSPRVFNYRVENIWFLISEKPPIFNLRNSRNIPCLFIGKLTTCNIFLSWC